MKELALVKDGKSPLPLHIISDTEQKYVKLRVLNPDKYYVLFEIEHAERVGAIDELMAVFRNRKANMIDSYSRLKSIAHSALFYALAEFSKKLTKRAVEAMLKELSCTASVSSIVLKGTFGSAGPPLDKLVLPESVSIRQGPVSRKPFPQGRKPEHPIDQAEEHGGTSRYELGDPYYLDVRGSSEWTLNTAQVFMAVPFGDDAYTEFYDHNIARPVKNAGLEPFRADRVKARAKRQTIIEKIEEGIARSRFVIADITDSNPNVIYEIGLAIGISKPVLLLCDAKHFDAREIPFDFQTSELIKYSPYGADRLRLQLADKIAQLKEDTP
jgi:hypothetical protein